MAFQYQNPAAAGAAPGSLQPSGQNPLAPPLMGVQAQQPLQQPAAPQPGGINPALTASILGLQNQQTQQNQVDRQMKLADSLRGDAKDQLQGQMVGRIYKSAGLANLAASIADNYGAMQAGKQANQRMGAMDAQRTAAMTQYFNALTGQNPQAPQAAPDAGAGQ